jgi:hypothetical protein
VTGDDALADCFNKGISSVEPPSTSSAVAAKHSAKISMSTKKESLISKQYHIQYLTMHFIAQNQ